ncbi:MAG: hypothetical protein FWC10_04600 [Lentimicrobiaceae bacterium]|nr:hypothetical protein [Lentimicrobiaceae bacterium]
MNNMKVTNKQKNETKQPLSERIIKLTKHPVTIGAFLLIILFAFFASYSAIFDKKLDSNGDNIFYFTCGKAIAEGKGYTNIMGFEEYPHTHFPPGYSYFISGVMKIFPNDILAVKKVNGILMYLSIVLLFFIIHKITGNTILAFITCLTCCFQQDLLRFSTIMMSEMLYLFLTLLSVYLALFVYKKSFLKNKLFISIITVLLLFFLNYAFLTRSMGMAIVFAVLLWMCILCFQSFFLWLKTRKNSEIETQNNNLQLFIQRGILFLLIFVTFFSTRTLWQKRQERCGKVGIEYMNDFTKKIQGGKMETFEDWKIRLTSNINHATTKLIPHLLYVKPYKKEDKSTTKDWALGIFVAIIMVFGVLYLKEGTLLLLFYIGASLCALIFYPEQYQGSRYTVAIIPLLLFLTFNGISAFIGIGMKLFRKKWNPYILQSIVVIIFAFFFLLPAHSKSLDEQKKSAKIKSWKTSTDANYKNFMEGIEWCGNNLPDTAHIICRKPELYYMYTGLRKCGGFPQYCEVDSMYRLLKTKNTEYLIVDNWFRHAYVTLFPVVQKYPEKFKVLHKIGDVDTLRKINPVYVFQFNDEWGYHGDLVDGKKEGKGYELFQDGRKYVGEFSNDKVNGYGELYDSTGAMVAKGYWKDGFLVRAHF